jgi:hypothetical protein
MLRPHPQYLSNEEDTQAENFNQFLCLQFIPSPCSTIILLSEEINLFLGSEPKHQRMLVKAYYDRLWVALESPARCR